MPDFHEYISRCSRYRAPVRWPVPTVAVLHGTYSYFHTHEGLHLPEHWFRMERDLLHQATAIASVSHYTARETAALFQLEREIAVLHNGIPIRADCPAEKKDDFQVIYTGTLVKKKGVFQLMKAWNLIQGEMPDARLLVLGKGEIEPVQALLAPQARDSVRFLGHVDQDVLQRHVAESAVAVFPSYAETFGLAPLEAMQAGVATLFTSRTSGPELIDDGEDGLLVEPDDFEGLAATILRLLRDPAERHRLGLGGRRKVCQVFDVDKVARKYATFFESVVSRQTSRKRKAA
jgi:glycosyltransferase involved in cell wall biosynthesis